MVPQFYKGKLVYVWVFQFLPVLLWATVYTFQGMTVHRSKTITALDDSTLTLRYCQSFRVAVSPSVNVGCDLSRSATDVRHTRSRAGLFSCLPASFLPSSLDPLFAWTSDRARAYVPKKPNAQQCFIMSIDSKNTGETSRLQRPKRTLQILKVGHFWCKIWTL